MVFPPQQAATDLDKKETWISMKDSVACEATTGVQCLFAGRAGP